MSFVITEADVEKIISENYWDIFHKGEDSPYTLTVTRQVNLQPYGVADIIACYKYNNSVPNIHILEIKAKKLNEADLAQTARYLSGIRNTYETLIEETPDLGKVVIQGNVIIDQYNPTTTVTATLIGLGVDENKQYTHGCNGDFVYLQQHCDIEVYLYEFSIEGLKFTKSCGYGASWTKTTNKEYKINAFCLNALSG